MNAQIKLNEIWKALNVEKCPLNVSKTIQDPNSRPKFQILKINNAKHPQTEQAKNLFLLSATVVEQSKLSKNLDRGCRQLFESRREHNFFRESFSRIHTKDENKGDAVLQIVSSIQNFKRDTSRKNGIAERAQLEEYKGH